MNDSKLTYTIDGDVVTFSDGWSYRRAPRAGAPAGQTYADPYEMRRILLGEGNPKATAAELAEAFGRKVQLGTVDLRS